MYLLVHCTMPYYCSMGDEVRPVQLRKVVLGYVYHRSSTEFKFDYSLSYKLPNVISMYSEGKPTLVWKFCIFTLCLYNIQLVVFCCIGILKLFLIWYHLHMLTISRLCSCCLILERK